MNEEDNKLLNNILPKDVSFGTVYNIRKNGKCVDRKVNEYINITSKEDGSGINIYVKEDIPLGIVDIPVLLTESGMTDVVYNDFFIGKNAHVTIVAGCGIHNPGHADSVHNGIHRFFLEEGANVRYIEKHYGEGSGDGKRILNPITEVYMKKDAYMVMDTQQLKGVSDTLRVTKAKLSDNATLIINEKILTTNDQKAKTKFMVSLDGKNSSTHVTSRSVAEDESYQEFNSNVIGNNACYGHVECDAIIKDKGCVRAIPKIYAKHIDARLIHEATIGKIAGEQFIKLMSLGLSAKDAEKVIIEGFLK